MTHHNAHNEHKDQFATNAIRLNKWNKCRVKPLIRTYSTQNGARYHLCGTGFDISAMIHERFALNGIAVLGRTNP